MSDRSTVLEVTDLKVHFPAGRRGLFGAPSKVHAVDSVTFAVRRGSTFGLVGESGSGKTTTALAVMRLAPITAGTVRLKGEPIDTLVLNALRREKHISHFTLAEAIDIAAELSPRQTWFTHISHQLGLHAQVQNELPQGINLGFDGVELYI